MIIIVSLRFLIPVIWNEHFMSDHWIFFTNIVVSPCSVCYWSSLGRFRTLRAYCFTLFLTFYLFLDWIYCDCKLKFVILQEQDNSTSLWLASFYTTEGVIYLLTLSQVVVIVSDRGSFEEMICDGVMGWDNLLLEMWKDIYALWFVNEKMDKCDVTIHLKLF